MSTATPASSLSSVDGNPYQLTKRCGRQSRLPLLTMRHAEECENALMLKVVE